MANFDHHQQKRASNNIDHLITLLQNEFENSIYYALTQLKALSSNNKDNKDLICDKGAVEHTVRLLDARHRNVIHDKALRLLRSLSTTSKNQIVIAQAGSIPLLLQFVNGDDAVLQVNAAATLWNLSVYESNKEAIGNAGGVEALVDLLSRTDRDNVRNEVVGALRNLSHHPPNRHRIVQHGGIPLLLRLIDPNTTRDSTRRHAVVTLVQCANSVTGLSAIQACGETTLQLLEDTCREVDSQMYRELCAQLASEAPSRAVSVNNRGGGGATSTLRSRKNTQQQQQQQHQQHRVGETPIVHHERRETMADEEMCMPFATETFGTMQWTALELEDQIGSGAYSVVYRARYHGYPVAVKLLNDPLPEEPSRREKMMQEFKLMAMLRHPNCLLYMGSALTPDNKIAIVSEHCVRGSLKENMRSVRSMTQRLKFAKDIISGLNWLHANNIVHRDLKPANILISSDWSARISDFGLSLVWFDSCVCLRFKGNVKFSAPEILAVRAYSDRRRGATATTYPYGPQTDVYSFALILWELVTNEPLFEGIRGKEEITEFVCEGNRPDLVPGWPRSLTGLLQRCWHHDPNQRLLFPLIQLQFPNVMIDFLCPDPLGRKIARDLWFDDQMRRVPYSEFESIFEERCKVDLSTGSECYRRCLQTMLCDPFTHLCSFQQWCNLVHWIGVMTPVKDFLNRLVRLFEQPWFFGFIRSSDAKRLLLEQQRRTPDADGYYLIRFSENSPGSYTIYSVNRDGQTEHRRISHQYCGSYTVTLDGQQGREFDDLFSLHDECCDAGTCIQGLAPLPGAPYQCFFASHPLHETSVVRRTSPQAGYDSAVLIPSPAAVAPPSMHSHLDTHAKPQAKSSNTVAPAPPFLDTVTTNNRSNTLFKMV